MNQFHAKSLTLFAIAIAGLLNWHQTVEADFVTFGNGFGSKWGDPNFGTSSGVITWSYMSPGTILAANHPMTLNGEITGSSNIAAMRNSFDTANSVGSFDQAIQNAFNTWSLASAGRITFQYVATDTGAPAGNTADPNSYAVDIRIGAFAASVANNPFGSIAGVGYGPPGNDLNFPDALAGDILLNINAPFFVAPGNEGDQFYFGGAYKNDLEGLMLHELGHAAIGLGHSTNGPNFPGLGDVMYVDNFPACCNFVNRQLSSQDIAGARLVYGIPEPTGAVLLTLLGVAWASVRKKRVLN